MSSNTAVFEDIDLWLHKSKQHDLHTNGSHCHKTSIESAEGILPLHLKNGNTAVPISFVLHFSTFFHTAIITSTTALKNYSVNLYFKNTG